MRIISISGLDGSGKSTQVQLLKEYLESQGKRVFYFHAINFSIANKIRYILHRPTEDVTSGENERSVTRSGKLGIMFRRIFLKIDIRRFNKLVEKLKNEGYDFLLPDRYFYDNLANIEYLSGSNKLPYVKIIKPDIAIYLQTSPETIMQRERKPDQGIKYLRKKKIIYDNCAEVWGLKIIDGNRPKEEIFKEIKNLIYAG